jgi:transposase
VINTFPNFVSTGIDEFEKLRRENEQLRAIFETAKEEFAKLKRKVSLLEEDLRYEKEKNRVLEEDNRSLKLELGESKGVVKKLSSMLFGLKSEKLKISDMDIKDAGVFKAEETVLHPSEIRSRSSFFPDEGKRPKGAVPGHPGYGRKIPEDLPIVEVVIEAPETELVCSQCGKIAAKKPGIELVSWQVSMRKEYFLKKIIRASYGPTCKCSGKSSIIMAPPVTGIIPKGKYSEEVWTDILVSKYMGHVPVDRQLFEIVQAGIDIKAGMVFNSLKRIYFEHLEPLYEMLLSDLRLAERWHADETRWKMFLPEGSELWYMWAFRSEKIVAFVLDPSRAASVPLKTLFNLAPYEAEAGLHLNTMPIQSDADQMKKLNVDRYSAYKVLAKYGLVLLSYCWAHARRDFIDIQKKFPHNQDICKWAEEWIVKIAELYRINNKRVKYPKGNELFLEYDTKLKNALEKMKVDSEKIYDNDAQTAVMKSTKEHWNGLTLFVEYPELPMDNNLMENGIRPCALGRNNFLGNHSIWGGNLTACMYSIIQTCLLNNINPRDYLLHYFNVCANNRGTIDSDRIRACLPYNLDIAVREKIALKKF